MREIKIVYQDCPMCGARFNWGLKQTALAAKNGIVLVKCPFYSPKAAGLTAKALDAGVTSFPYFTDGEKFSMDLEDFIEKPTKKTKKTTKRSK